MFGHKRHIDDSYKDLLQLILDTGYNLPPAERQDVGSRQITSHEISCDLRDGFPLLTTKQMYYPGIFVELEWFIRGLTNIRWLRQRKCGVWDADAYKYYIRRCNAVKENPYPEEDFFAMVDAGDKSTTLEHQDGAYYTYGDLGPVYGAMWRNYPYVNVLKDESDNLDKFFGLSKGDFEYNNVDQLSNLIHDIKAAISKGYNNRRMIVDAWHPFLSQSAALPPCHKDFQVLLEPIPTTARTAVAMSRGLKLTVPFEPDENWSQDKMLDELNVPAYYLNLIWSQRSVDTFLGLPFNIASYAALAELLAFHTNCVAKTLTGQLRAVHIYDNHLDAVKTQLSREAIDLPTLNLNQYGETLLDFTAAMVEVDDYKYHPRIKAKLNA